MASLIVETSGLRRGGPIPGRVLIGRLPTNGIALNDSSVSRLHAWIDQYDGEYFVADTGSLTGTSVNGNVVARRVGLRDGDQVKVGKSIITFRDDDEMPGNVAPLDMRGRPPLANVAEAGVLFECVCGAPAWFKATAIGQHYTCRQCGTEVLIPERSGVVAEPINGVAAVPPPPVRPAAIDAVSHGAVADLAMDDLPGAGAATAEMPPPADDLHGIREFELDEPVVLPTEDEGGNRPPPPPRDDRDVEETLSVVEEFEDEPAAEPSSRHSWPSESEPAGSALDELAAEEPLPMEVAPAATADEAEEFGDAEPVATHASAAVTEPAPASFDDAVVTEDVLEAEEYPAFEPATESAPHPQPALAEHPAPLAAPAEPEPQDEFEQMIAEEAAALAREGDGGTALAPAARVRAAAPAAEAMPTIREEATDPTCSVCHSPIHRGEATTTCPACGLTFHAECWQENLGCSAYGCSQVGALAPVADAGAAEPIAAGHDGAPYDYDEDPEAEGFPWEFIFLGVSVLGILLGIVSWGVPSLISLVGNLIYRARLQTNARRRPVVLVAVVLSVLGIAVGVGASYYWWFRVPVGKWVHA